MSNLSLCPQGLVQCLECGTRCNKSLLSGFSEWTHEQLFGYPQKGPLSIYKRLIIDQEPKQRARAKLGSQVRWVGPRQRHRDIDNQKPHLSQKQSE